MMGESALELYFDNFIAKDSSKMEMEQVDEELDDELFFSLLPDELLTQSSQHDTDSSTNLDSNSQSSTAPASSVWMPVKEQPEMSPQIRNVISTVKLGCCLDLNFIACKAWNVEYNPKTFKALIMRIREPRTTAMIYTSGIIVCTGAKSEEQSLLAARKYARIVQKLGFPARFLRFQIHNLVASCKTFPVRLEQLAHHRHSSYEPELFPGLFHTVMPGITVIIFSSGTMSLSGAKTEAEVYEAFNIIYPLLSCCRRR